VADERFDLDLLDEEDPFEIDTQAAHLFKHPHLGIDDIDDVWASDPLFYRPSRRRTGSCAPTSGAGCLWFRWLPRAAVTRTDAVRSAATRQRTGWPPSTGETDDEHTDDT
jgi:hypothetical protein